jgi:peptide/nickel transport system ATP-binding protein
LEINQPILQVKNLKTYFNTDNGIAHAVDNVSFNLNAGETLGIVGESGCGKSVTSLSIMRLIDQPPGFFAGGEILFNGENLLDMNDGQMRNIRGNKISMIFQEPMTSLNPVFTIGNQIIEAVQLHQKLDYKNSRKKAIEMLDLVGIPAPDQRIDEYPHQLSGGMRQRVMIAISLSCNPEILIADEPTTALDVTIQAQILELIQQLQSELNLAVIMITHDLGLISEICNRVIVMYAGQVVEQGTIKEIFKSPKHPYTAGLMKSIPVIGENKNKELYNIKGLVPNATDFPIGCHFHPRCEFVVNKCKEELPNIESITNNSEHLVRCWEA